MSIPSTGALRAAVEGILFDDQYKGALQVLKGMRNGIVYGVQIRAPHAFVMTMLFRNGSFVEKLRAIIQLTYAHAKNLFLFVGIYKTFLVLLRYIFKDNRPVHSLLAGAIG